MNGLGCARTRSQSSRSTSRCAPYPPRAHHSASTPGPGPAPRAGRRAVPASVPARKPSRGGRVTARDGEAESAHARDPGLEQLRVHRPRGATTAMRSPACTVRIGCSLARRPSARGRLASLMRRRHRWHRDLRRPHGAPLGFGAMRITGRGIWGPPPDRDVAIAVLRRAVELGVNLIDTADSYGPAVSEELIAEALHPYPADLVIATKGGLERTGPGAVAGQRPSRPPQARLRGQPAPAAAGLASTSTSSTGPTPACRTRRRSARSRSCARPARSATSGCPT